VIVSQDPEPLSTRPSIASACLHWAVNAQPRIIVGIAGLGSGKCDVLESVALPIT
jgi:hypothetical protein